MHPIPFPSDVFIFGLTFESIKELGGASSGLHKHIFQNLERYCITLAKPRRHALLASFCNNIVNHERK
jgi:hypothetical protein